MSWFGGGSKSDDSSSAGGKDFTNPGETAGFGGGSNFAGSSSSSAGNAAAELQQASIMLQQQMLVQQVINDLTDRGYEKCITGRPSEQLSGSQAACIRSTVNKWLDTNEFMTDRLGRKQQAAASHHTQY
jgi:Tim10/DDP family zinc finger